MKNFKKLWVVMFLVVIFIFNSNFVFAKSANKQSIPPTAPTLLCYSGVTSSEVTLNWQAVSKATSYKVYRATTNDANYTLIATISTNSFKNISLAAGTKYWYFVRASNSYGTSPDSTHISLTTTQVASIAKKLILGFSTYYYSGDASSYNSITANTSTLDEIATLTYTTDGSGNISGLVPSNQIAYANDNNIKSLAMVANNFDGNIQKHY